MSSIVINIRQLQDRYTGVQSYIYNLTKYLIVNNSKQNFILVTYSYDNKNNFVEELIGYKNVRHVNLTGPKNAIFNIYFDHILIGKVLKKGTIYINPVNISPVFKSKDVTYIIGILDLCTFVVPNTTTLTLWLYYRLFLPSSIKRANKIFCISKNTSNDLIRIFNVSSSKVRTIYLGADEEIISTNRESKRKSYILMMATSWRKNILNMLSAYKKVIKKNKNINLKVIVNNPAFAEQIQDKVEELGISDRVVLFKEYLSKNELSNLFSNSVCFVYCPLYEGFGLPVLEAMRARTLVVCSNNSSLPEIANGYAILVNPYSVKAIKNGINKAIKISPKERAKLVERSEKWSKKFTWRETAKQLIEYVYE